MRARCVSGNERFETEGFPLSENTYTAFARNLMSSVKVTGPRPTPQLLETEILSGLTVALALVPEAVAFSFVAGVSNENNKKQPK